jgi:hypothetical protein
MVGYESDSFCSITVEQDIDWECNIPRASDQLSEHKRDSGGGLRKYNLQGDQPSRNHYSYCQIKFIR